MPGIDAHDTEPIHRKSTTHRRARGLALRAFVATSAIAAAGVAEAQRPPLLPEPTGEHSIGRVLEYWTDGARADPFDEDVPRTLAVELWYPAAPTGGSPSNYVEVPEDWVPIYGEQARQFNAMVQTHSRDGAPAPDGDARFPVVVFSHGANQSRRFYSALYEEWASRGFVVAAISHPHACSESFAGGVFLRSSPRWSPPGELFEPDRDADLYAFWEPMIEVLSADQRFVLDQLELVQAGELATPLTGRLDLERVAVAGHSRGAKAAFRTARTDPRVDACLVLDDPPPPAEREGVGVPLLVLMPMQPSPAMARTTDRLLDRSDSPVTAVQLRGSGHMSYVDLVLVAPEQFGIPRETAYANHARIRTLTRDFLAATLRGDGTFRPESDDEITVRRTVTAALPAVAPR